MKRPGLGILWLLTFAMALAKWLSGRRRIEGLEGMKVEFRASDF